MPMKEPQDNLASLLQVKNANSNTADLYIYGSIVSSWWGAWDEMDQYPESIKKFLDGAKGKNLNIYINSGGGSVFAGMAIYNMLKRHQGLKTVRVDGIAASIASVIALAGDRVIIPSNAYMMIHKPWSWGEGNADEFRKMAEILDSIQKGIMSVYTEHLRPGVTAEIIAKMVDAETWMTGDEAAKYFNIEVDSPVKAVAYTGELKFSNVPKPITQSLAAYNARLNLLKLKGEMNRD